MTLPAGTRLGPYEILSAIGAGGMGEVYRGRDATLNRDVAIKVLPAALAADHERLARFKREAQVLASLNHPNVAHVYGFEAAALPDGSMAHFLAMELVEGEDLSERLKRGPIPVDESIAIAKQIAEGLEEAHEHGIIHRDLKPANVKVTPDGRVKVLDFGLAKAYESDGTSSAPDLSHSPTMSRHATEAGMIMGTAAYMSPEQARGKMVDKRADIWAFGVVLYEMLTGARLFKGETVSDTLAAVLMKDPDLSLLPPHLRGLVGRCLDRDPRKRLRDIGDLGLLLDQGASRATAAEASGRRMWPWALGAFAAGALVILGLVTTRQPSAPVTPVAFLESPPPGTRFVGTPILSPDGRRLAMVAVDGAGMTRLWTRELSDPAAHAIEGADGLTPSMIPFWSPDSQQIAFLAQGQVRRVAPLGGPASLVVAASPGSGVWLKDGDLLLEVHGEGLMRVPAAGGTLRAANGFSSADFRNLQIDDLALSPDGRTILFTQFGGETGIYAARIDGASKRLLYPGEQSAAAFAGPDLIVREDTNVLMAQRFNPADLTLSGDAFPVASNVGAADFSGGASGALSFVAGARRMARLVWFARDGKAEGSAGPEGFYEEVTVSRRGKLLAFSRADAADGNVDVWIQALPGGAPNRLTSDPDRDHLIALSYDEGEVVWEAHAQGTLNVMRRAADGSSPAERIRTWGRGGGPSDWSPDGRFVLYHSSDGAEGSNLWAVPLQGTGEPVRLSQPGFGADDGQFSPDGRYLAFTGDATGGTEVYVQRFEGMKLVGGPVRVSENGGRCPQWRGDGAELFFVNRGTIMAASFNGALDRPAGAPRALFTVAGFGGLRETYRNYAPMPDGQRFVAIVSPEDAAPRPATVILNWRSASTR